MRESVPENRVALQSECIDLLAFNASQWYECGIK